METFNNHNVPLRNGNSWKFCAVCGNRMVWIRTNDSYDRSTGTYGPNYSWRCPNWRTDAKFHDVSNTTVRSPKEKLNQ